VVANALRLLNFERDKEHQGIDHEDAPPRKKPEPAAA